MCMHAFGAVGVCVHLPTATATGTARSSQLSSSLPGQAVRCIIACWRSNPSPPANLGRTPCWFSSLRPMPSVVPSQYKSGDVNVLEFL
jgi:hypothetical protein